MRKKTAWIAAMLVVAAALVCVVNSRIALNPEVIFGGFDSVFVRGNELENTEEEDKAKAEKENDSSDYSDLDFPNIDINAWCFILINDSHLVKDYDPEVVNYPDTEVYFDEDAYYQLVGLIEAAKDAGFSPYISNGYISYTAQQQLFNAKAIEISEKQKCSFEDAQTLAEKEIMLPGTSDHQSALAVDITDKQYDVYDYSKMDMEFFAWLDKHCAEYGFIKRYPSNKSSITGHDEPWHYRYVGAASAKFITENGLCLEEFVEHYDYQKS